MIQPKVIPSLKPHTFLGAELVVSRGNAVGTLNIQSGLTQFKHLGKYTSSKSYRNLLCRWDLPKRVLRLGFHDLGLFRNGIIGVQYKAIVYKENDSEEFKDVFNNFRGSRPLALFTHPQKSKLYFGEYFNNEHQEEVYIFGSNDGKNWYKAWTFKAGSIRHVHGLIWDEFRHGIWVLTGDSDDESGLWFTNDDFGTLTQVISGSQMFRAVEIIPTMKGLIIPMDSPMEQNYIHFFDPDTKKIEKLNSLPGSAFHAIHSNDIYLISTVTEPSEVNKVNYASVWASLDGKDWKEVSRFKRDWIPVKYQFIGRYAEVYFPGGLNNSDYIFGYGQAIKGMSNSMLLWKKEEIVTYLAHQ